MNTSPQLCPHSLSILLLSYIYILKTENIKLGIVVIPTTQLLRKVEICVSEVQGHPYLASEFKANVGYLRLLPPKRMRNEPLAMCSTSP